MESSGAPTSPPRHGQRRGDPSTSRRTRAPPIERDVRGTSSARFGERALPLAFLLAAACGSGCNRAQSAALPATGETTTATTVDEHFRDFVKRLPERGVAEQNGPVVPCLNDRSATSTRLRAIASTVPIENDLDLARLVPWARHPDPCISQIALQSLVIKVGYDASLLEALLDPEHLQVHDIFVSTKAYLDRAHVPYEPAIFDGLLLTTTARDFPALIHGTWSEDESFAGFKDVVEVLREHVRITRELLPAGSRPDSTLTTKIASVVVGDRGQFVVTVTGASSTTGAGSTPEPLVYSFLPVKTGVMWFKDGQHARWKKMRKAGPR